MWTAHNIAVDATGVASIAAQRRDAVRWYELIIPPGSGTPTVNQSGTIFDSAATVATARQFFIPSVTVSGQGHAAFGFSTAGTPFRIDAATTGRLSGDAPGTTGAVAIYTASSSAYNPPADPGGGTGRRWGRYSFTSVDPNDDMTMWTIQEFTNATNSYGVRVAKLLAPPPATPASATPSFASAGLASTIVTVSGTSGAGSGFFDPGAGFASRLTASVSGGVTVNSVTYINPTTVSVNISTVGASAGLKNVTITNPDGQSVTGNSIFNVTAGCAFALAPTSAILASVASSGHAVNVTAAAPTCAWTASTAAGWISFGTGSGLGNGVMTFAVLANTTGLPRSASISVGDQTFVVNQRGRDDTPGDFDGDARADLLWRNSATGANIGWLMNGLTLSASAFLPTIADTNWKVVGIGDVNGDHKTDVLWRNGVTGANVGWLMNGLTVGSSAFLPAIADTNWAVVGIGDVNGDGKADVFWRNGATGANIVWVMNGLTVSMSAFLPAIADVNWKIVAVGDLSHDGKADVLWRNAATGANIGWLMNGLVVGQSAFLPTIADTNWQVVGVGDVSGDGHADVIWRNRSSGADIGWLMNGLTVSLAASLPTIADTNWKIVTVGDLNGDGKADIVFRNAASGQNIGWLMNGLTLAGSAFLPTIADTNWQIVR